MKKFIAPLMVTALLASGCGSSETAEEEPPPPVSYSFEQLEAAVPPVDQIDEAEGEPEWRCPGDDETFECGDNEVSVSFTLTSPKAPDQQELDAAEYDYVPRSVSIDAERFEDPAAATKEHETGVSTLDEIAGEFDVPAEDREEGGWVSGRKGSGSVESIDIGGWTGSIARSEQVLINPDGEEFSPEFGQVQIRLVYGTTTLAIFSAVPTDSGGLERAEMVAESVASGYIDRLADGS